MGPLSYKGPRGCEPLRAMASGMKERGCRGGTRTRSWKRTEALEESGGRRGWGTLVAQWLGLCASTA